jgi:mannose-6-phosphate isomerase-like protein (cupin superfamily)
MKLTSLEEAPFIPVSHDPQLKKQVLFGKGTLPHIVAISHIEMKPGDTAISHKHDDAYEVFFGMAGRIDFVVEGEDVPLTQGKCLIVEPGETHSIRDAAQGSRMLYFLMVK